MEGPRLGASSARQHVRNLPLQLAAPSGAAFLPETRLSELVRYEAACRAVAEAKTTDEVVSISHNADAMRLYARQANNKQLEIDAAEIRIRAERRLGELIVAQKETVGLARGGQPYQSATCSTKEQVETPTLAEVGIDRKLSMRAQKLASMPSGDFGQMLDNWRSRIVLENERVTTNILRAVSKAEQIAEATIAEKEGGCTVQNLQDLIAAGRKFGCIYADPPWLYDNQSTRAATSNHYGGMTVAEICDLPIRELAADDAHLHLWTTNGFLFECPKIFEAWGFEFRSSFVWVKPKLGIGNYWRNSHEILLTAIRGDAKRFNDRALKSWLECDRGRHSAKPEQVRHMIEKASEGPFLELFGRSPAPGWSVWGNEVSPDLLSLDIPEFAA
jgi:N6-adenosine-specific RNA methylase IME4